MHLRKLRTKSCRETLPRATHKPQFPDHKLLEDEVQQIAELEVGSGFESSKGTKTKFTPGSIHEQHRYKYWEETLKANKWVLNTLKHGYILPFVSDPPPYEERNNASAQVNCLFVEQQVKKTYPARSHQVSDGETTLRFSTFGGGKEES